MFHFRKKTKTVSHAAAHRKRSAFMMKSVSRKKTLLAQSDVENQHMHNEWYRLYGLLWAVFAAVVVYALMFSPFLRMDTIRIDGTVGVSEQAIEQLVRSEMAGVYFGFIPKDNFFVFSHIPIETDIRERFKKVNGVDVSRVFPHTLTVHVRERKTIVQWCINNEICFYIDENGYAYAPVNATQSSEQSGRLLKIIDTSGQAVDANEPVLDREFVRFSADIQEKLQQELNIEIDTECSTPSRFSEELALKTKEGWEIFVDVRFPLEKSLRTLKLLFKKEISEERRQHLKYIDMRTESRIYYSVDGEVVSAPDVSDPASQQSIAPVAGGTTAEKEKRKK